MVDTKRMDDVLSLVARLQLFVDDDVEPRSEETLEADLSDLYQWLVTVERAGARWKAARRN